MVASRRVGCSGSRLDLVPSGGSSGGWGWAGRSLVEREQHRGKTGLCYTCRDKERREHLLELVKKRWCQRGEFGQGLIRASPSGLTWLVSLASVGCTVG